MSNVPATLLTIKDVQESLPASLRKSVTQTFVDKLNALRNDEGFYDHYLNSIITHETVLSGGRYKFTDYLNAVEYVSRKLMGKSNFEAFRETFPDRVASYLNNGISNNQIHAYVSAYNSNKLVTNILEQSMIPIHISHQHIFYKAIAKQVAIMDNPDVSFKVQSDTAHNLAVLLAPPKESKIQVDIGFNGSNALDELNENLTRLVDVQLKAISDKTCTAGYIAESKLITGGSHE